MVFLLGVEGASLREVRMENVELRPEYFEGPSDALVDLGVTDFASVSLDMLRSI